MEFIEIASEDEVKTGTVKKVNAAGREILVSNIGGKYFAVDNRCPHLGGDLSKGFIEGSTVICPKHGSRFDLITGKNITGPQKSIFKVIKSLHDLKTYELKVKDGKIIAQISQT
jgi:3-phenylpropionate/trans-cinnamate dioxygenase ferredoxin component